MQSRRMDYRSPGYDKASAYTIDTNHSVSIYIPAAAIQWRPSRSDHCGNSQRGKRYNIDQGQDHTEVRACTKSLVEWLDNGYGITHPYRPSARPDLRSKVRINSLSAEVKTLMKGAFSAMTGVMVLSWNPFMAWMQGLETIKVAW